MRTTVTLIWLIALGVAAVAGAQDAYLDDTDPPRETEVPSAGFWPTERMVELIIDRITEELSGHYGFDEDQLHGTRLIIKERFPDWLQDNRAEIQGLVNTYVEIMLDEVPPTPEEIAVVARRALSLFDEFKGLTEETVEDMRLIMTDEQQVMLDGEKAAFDVFMNHGRQRLLLFGEGGFDPTRDWHGSPGYEERLHDRERQVREEAEQARRAAMGLKAVEEGIAPPGADAEKRPATASGEKALDEWEQYVEDFIRRYQLDAGQQNSARKFLHTMREIRDRYLRKRLPEIRKLEEKLRAADTDEQQAQVQAEYKRINEPLERYFQRLKDKLEKLPTRKQRAAAAERAKTAMHDQMMRRAEPEKATPDGKGEEAGGSE